MSLFIPNGAPVPRQANNSANISSKYNQSLLSGNLEIDNVKCSGTITSRNIYAGTVNNIYPQEHSYRHTFIGEDPLIPATSSDITEISDYISSAGIDNEKIPRADHVHAHGNRGGGTLHSTATSSTAGFMSAEDKMKMDLVNPSINIPKELDLSNSGSSGSLWEYARADHIHAHGNLLGGTLHSVATCDTAGFMSAGDKGKLDIINPTNQEPKQLGVACTGSSLDYSRADHVHTHGSLEGGNLHQVANYGMAGFMSAEDKHKLDLIYPTNQEPKQLGVVCTGSLIEYARADHVHAHGNLEGGSMHTEATITSAGFMSAEDKQKLINIPAGVNSCIQYNSNGSMGFDQDFNYDHVAKTLSVTNAKFENIPAMPLKRGMILMGSELDLAEPATIYGDVKINDQGKTELTIINDKSGRTILSEIITNEKGLVLENKSATLSRSSIWVGSENDTPVEVDMHGDVTLDSEGLVTLTDVNQDPKTSVLSEITTNSKGQVISNKTATLNSSCIWIGSSDNQPSVVHVHGDASISNKGALTLSTVNVDSGLSKLSTVLTNSKGQVLSNKSATLKQGNVWVGSATNVPEEVNIGNLVTKPFSIIYGKDSLKLNSGKSIDINGHWDPSMLISRNTDSSDITWSNGFVIPKDSIYNINFSILFSDTVKSINVMKNDNIITKIPNQAGSVYNIVSPLKKDDRVYITVDADIKFIKVLSDNVSFFSIHEI
jgi:hypothetical protein